MSLFPRRMYTKITIRDEEELQNLSRTKLQMLASVMIYQRGDYKWSPNWKSNNVIGLRDPVDRMATKQLITYVGDRINSYPHKFRLNKFEEHSGKRGLAYVLGYNTRKSAIVNKEQLRVIEAEKTRPSDKKFKIFFKLSHFLDSDKKIEKYVKIYSTWNTKKTENRALKTDIRELIEAYGLLEEYYEDLYQECDDLEQDNERLNQILAQVNQEIELQEEN